MAYLFDNDKSKVNFDTAIQPKLDALQTTFQNNINLIYDTIVDAGVTPTGKTPSELATGINDIQRIRWSEKLIAGESMSEIYLSLPYKNIDYITVNSFSGEAYINGAPVVVPGTIIPFGEYDTEFIVEVKTPLGGGFIGEYKIDMTITYQAKILR